MSVERYRVPSADVIGLEPGFVLIVCRGMRPSAAAQPLLRFPGGRYCLPGIDTEMLRLSRARRVGWVECIQPE